MLPEIEIPPGECRPDVTLELTGSLVYCCQLSSSMSLFTLRLEKELSGSPILDVILKKKEGWSSPQMTEIHQQLEATDIIEGLRIGVTGYLERMRPKYPTDSAPLCLHPKEVRLGEVTVFQAKETIEEATRVPPSDNEQAGNSQSITKNSSTSNNTNNNKSNNHSGASDKTRFARFVQFLLDEFGGYEALSQKPVLDVAGGAGGLAFELSVRHEIPTLVVDSRPVKLQGPQKRHLKFRQTCLDRLANVNGKSPVAMNLKNRFQIKDFEQLATLLDIGWILEEELSMPLDETQQKLRQILRNKECSMLLGLHPDQATDPIVDIGFALQIPWAVVPCCVFPNFFKQRQLNNAQPVRNYEDLCQYLRERDPNVQEKELPFQGRNRVFYWSPPSG